MVHTVFLLATLDKQIDFDPTYSNSPVPKEWCMSVWFFIAVTPENIRCAPGENLTPWIFTGISNNVHDWAKLCVCTGMSTISAQLARTKSRYKSTCAIEARVPKNHQHKFTLMT